MDRHTLLTQIDQILDASSQILITGQGNPDGDSLGAQLALYDILLQQKTQSDPRFAGDIVICNDEPVPEMYRFFPNIERVVPFDRIQTRRFDVGFVLDSGTDRVGKLLPVLQECRHVINIDHHKSRAQGIETLAWIEPDVCSVAEMVYAFFEHPDWNPTLTPDIAACLYAGIIYDTGTFRYSNTTARTHRITAKLLETGIDFSILAEKLFLEKSMPEVRLLSEVLDTLHLNDSGEIIWGEMTQAILARTGTSIEQDAGIITQYGFTRGTKVAVLFKEVSDAEVKVSFRARGALDVGAFARKMSVKGGGHARAAGCTLSGTLQEARDKIIPALEQALSQELTIKN